MVLRSAASESQTPDKRIVVVNAKAILPDGVLDDAVVVVESGRIAEVTSKRTATKDEGVIDLRGGYLAPGFVDLHVHGGGGADFMDGTANAVRTACRTHAGHGTTTIFPTTTTGSPDQIEQMLAACREVRNAWQPSDGARIAGVHLYGPYFAADKVGCHAKEGRRDPTPAEYEGYFRDDLVRIATCAAELPGADAFYRRAKQCGCLVTCGHSNATWSEMTAAFGAGVRHVDHFWCAMSSVASLRARCGTPMQASMEQFVLATPEMSTEVIADGAHLSVELMRFAWQMLGPKRLCLVTDANRAVDMPAGKYRFGSDVDGPWFVSDGSVGRDPETGGLASSIMGMDHMVRMMVRGVQISIWDAVRMASLTPAERAGVANEVGSLEVGKCANLLWLDRNLILRGVWLVGEPVPLTRKA